MDGEKVTCIVTMFYISYQATLKNSCSPKCSTDIVVHIKFKWQICEHLTSLSPIQPSQYKGNGLKCWHFIFGWNSTFCRCDFIVYITYCFQYGGDVDCSVGIPWGEVHYGKCSLCVCMVDHICFALQVSSVRDKSLQLNRNVSCAVVFHFNYLLSVVKLIAPTLDGTKNIFQLQQTTW